MKRIDFDRLEIEAAKSFFTRLLIVAALYILHALLTNMIGN